MIPLLDIGQGIPVLGFLPGLVLGMVALFPHSNVGLELACILMIFTGQVWNMVFSFYGSLRSDPVGAPGSGPHPPVRLVQDVPDRRGLLVGDRARLELDDVDGRRVVLPDGQRGVHARQSRLPPARAWAPTWPWRSRRATAARCSGRSSRCRSMIVAVDQLLWKPLVAWSERFRLEELASAEKPRSWVLDLIRRSPLMRRLRRARRDARRRAGPATAAALAAGARRRPPSPAGGRAASVRRCSRLLGAAAVGARGLGRLAARPPPRCRSAAGVGMLAAALGATFLRTAGALARGRALDRAGRDPHRPFADVVAPAPARRPARGVVSRAHDLSAGHRRDARSAASRSP